MIQIQRMQMIRDISTKANDSLDFFFFFFFFLTETACSPARFEADVALNLEICEKINAKGGGL